MYPVLFRIGGFEITSFGAMVAVGALVGLWLFRRELLRSRLPESAVDTAIAGLAGGIAGAKLLWVFEHLGEEPFTVTALQPRRTELVRRFRRRPPRGVRGDAAAAAAADRRPRRGHAGTGGRSRDWPDWLLPGWRRLRPPDHAPVGCGVPRRPAAHHRPGAPDPALRSRGPRADRLVLLYARRAGYADRRVLGLYLVLAGAVRFAIEFIRDRRPRARHPLGRAPGRRSPRSAPV